VIGRIQQRYPYGVRKFDPFNARFFLILGGVTESKAGNVYFSDIDKGVFKTKAITQGTGSMTGAFAQASATGQKTCGGRLLYFGGFNGTISTNSIQRTFTSTGANTIAYGVLGGFSLFRNYSAGNDVLALLMGGKIVFFEVSAVTRKFFSTNADNTPFGTLVPFGDAFGDAEGTSNSVNAITTGGFRGGGGPNSGVRNNITINPFKTFAKITGERVDVLVTERQRHGQIANEVTVISGGGSSTSSNFLSSMEVFPIKNPFAAATVFGEFAEGVTKISSASSQVTGIFSWGQISGEGFIYRDKVDFINVKNKSDTKVFSTLGRNRGFTDASEGS